jgi:NTE family protein
VKASLVLVRGELLPRRLVRPQRGFLLAVVLLAPWLLRPVVALGQTPNDAGATPAAAAVSVAAAPAGPARRPRIGLVLSGGGARGLAHVGVLQVLEQARVPIDAIAGTSMGAIIGGLYASGVPVADLERELLALDWDALFATRVPRASLTQRRKEEDFEVSPAIELGLEPGSGRFMLPLGGVSSRGLELLLRRHTLAVRQAASFDELPIPFRAVATDMETGTPVIFDRGDLATALRASMSVPGVFAPVAVDGRILGDGGLVDNLPVDVLRRLGVDVVIAVNIGTPLQPRSTLGTVSGVTLQMINILTEQNVQRSLAQLDLARGDLLINPPLTGLASTDFARVADFIHLGRAEAQARLPELQARGLSEAAWAQHQAQRAAWQRAPAAPVLATVRFEGGQISRPEIYAAQLDSRPGQAFDPAAAEADSRALAANDDYQHVDYRLEDLPEVGPGATGLVFRVDEKPWGPNYFRAGLELASDFAGRGEFNLKLSHNRHWLNSRGGEWRNKLQLGSTPRWSSEWYQPLGASVDPGGGWFSALHVDGERRRGQVYLPIAPTASGDDARLLARYARSQGRVGVDLGQPWGAWGELRTGLQAESVVMTPELVADLRDLLGTGGSASLPVGTTLRSRELALRSTAVVDQLDYTSFPTRGYRLRLQLALGRRSANTDLLPPDGREAFRRLELDANRVQSLGPYSLDASLRLRYADQSLLPVLQGVPGTTLGLGQYTLGGFQNLSGYELDQLSGNQVLLGKLVVYRRLNEAPVLTRGFFAGASLELGNAWARRSAVRGGELRTGSSVFLGADTGLGPLYLGLTWAPQGSSGVFLQLGRP